ncbi:MAG: DegT/DnrJ/EryC1/StrS family aminotransferase [Nitrospirae bacterium]|nr:DegT/DnrJ/EryC1/StrS family aminotransferase [Nitrospirota bacterium]
MRKINISTPSLGKDEWDALKGPLFNGWVTQGPRVAEFERSFAEKHDVAYAIATTSCTTALHLALAALGIGAGDEVIVPAFTWIATANVVEYTGARPVFCDIDRTSYNIDPSQAEKLITSKTRAIIPVHLFGLCADMERLSATCRARGIRIIEDAACAAGASYMKRMAGSFGDIGCFSFHPRKIITTGEGGMCTTNDKELADRMICLRNHGASVSEEERHGGPRPYLMPDFNMLGFNYRMTDIQGAVGSVQLGKLSSLIKERQHWAGWYREQLADLPWLRTPVVPEGFEHVYQSYVCYVDEDRALLSRNAIMERLHAKGISTRPGTHAVHMLNYYAIKYGLRPEDYPAARDCDRNTLAIPLHNKMEKQDYEYIIQVLKGLR